MLVLAASSLTGPLSTVVERWEETHDARIDVSFGGSSKLASQIQEGVGADVFLSANRKWVEHLDGRNLLASQTRKRLLSNKLVWVVPVVRSDVPKSLEQVIREPPENLALAGPSVPAGMYARQALGKAGHWESLAPHAVSAENVKRALQWVAMGEASAGVVYQTDAVANEDVAIAFEIPQQLQPTIIYEGAVLRDAGQPDAARAFLEYLTEPEARRVFREAGFSPPKAAAPNPNRAASEPKSGVDEASAIALSLKVGLACVLGGLLPAILLGWLLARREFFGKSIVATLLLAPIALPPVVTGFILLRMLGRSGWLGPALATIGLDVPFTTLGAAIAAFVVSFPLFLLTARSAFSIVDRRYEEVSMTLGYSRPSTFWRITIPLALPGLAAGALLAFARAIGEFGATAVLAGNVPGETQTIPLAIYTMLESPSGHGAIWTLVGFSLVLALAAVVGFEHFNRRQERKVN